VGVRNDVVGFRNNVVGVGSGDIGIDRKFSLETDGRRRKRRSERTYVEDLEDLVEIRRPARDLGLIVLCVEEARSCIALALFLDIPLDLRHSSEIGSTICQLSTLCTVVSTHVCARFIASRTS
jgi:hypothetical protein